METVRYDINYWTAEDGGTWLWYGSFSTWEHAKEAADRLIEHGYYDVEIIDEFEDYEI